MRIGHGYDVHRLKEGRKCIIGGVDIPHSAGLDGHSDADVLTHAIMDALLGAACLGDIGHLFPDNDDAFLGIDSLILLRKVNAVLKEHGYRLSNLDATIIAQAPKMAPHILTMRENIAHCLDTDIKNVSIKATTEERLGFTGEKLGIAAHAVCLLETIE
jgi:2-C-methyl-D-erythritol 2,4-cyclodiphosphate synthase